MIEWFKMFVWFYNNLNVGCNWFSNNPSNAFLLQHCFTLCRIRARCYCIDWFTSQFVFRCPLNCLHLVTCQGIRRSYWQIRIIYDHIAVNLICVTIWKIFDKKEMNRERPYWYSKRGRAIVIGFKSTIKTPCPGHVQKKSTIRDPEALYHPLSHNLLWWTVYGVC